MTLFHRCLVVAVLCLLPVPAAAVPFTRGDVDQGGRIDIADAIRILDRLFGGGQGVSCDDAADVDDDGSLTISDPILLLEALFRGGSAPSAPFPTCGEDPTEDGLSCEAYEACGFSFGFFGHEFSGDAVFFLIDKSGTMLDSGELTRAKNELRKVVEAMPDGVRFSVIFFDANVFRFPASPEPAVASSETRASAVNFINQMPGGPGTCPGLALHAALDAARLSGARRNLIFYLSDGGATCRGGLDEPEYWRTTIEQVTLANSGLARIYTFAFDSSALGQSFLKELAERNGGALAIP